MLNLKRALPISLIFLLALTIPSKSDMKTIIGGGLAWKGTQLEGVSDLPQNLIDVTNKFLEDMKEKGE